MVERNASSRHAPNKALSQWHSAFLSKGMRALVQGQILTALIPGVSDFSSEPLEVPRIKDAALAILHQRGL